MILRPPNWRLELAGLYADEVKNDFTKVEFDEKEDPYIKKLTEFLCDFSNGTLSRRKLMKKFPYISEAYALSTDKDNIFSDRWLLEAALVAELSSKEIAKYLCIDDTKFVDTFCKCFFDLRDKSIKQRYIRNINKICENKTKFYMQDLGWKVLAIALGWESVDRVFMNRHLMTAVDFDFLRSDQKNIHKITAWWCSQKRELSVDQIRTEEELMAEKQNIDIDQANERQGPDSGSLGNSDAQLGNIVTLVGKEIEMTLSGSSDSPNEERLTKKRK